MGRAILWFVHFLYWLRVHRNLSRAAWVTTHELGRAWKWKR